MKIFTSESAAWDLRDTIARDDTTGEHVYVVVRRLVPATTRAPGRETWIIAVRDADGTHNGSETVGYI